MITPTQEYRRTSHERPRKLLTGLDAAVHGAIGYYRRRGEVLKELRQLAEETDAQAGEWKERNNHQLHEKLFEFRAEFRRRGKAVPELLAPALAAIREAADRQLGLRPFVVQLMGALALHRGYLAEMATGEGKTLTAGVAAVLAGWTRRPCHIVTVNDYLVKRDAEWLDALYQFCGVRVGYVTGGMAQPERRKGYACEVTYTTSKELLADFLRDRMHVGALQNPTRRLIRQLIAPRLAAEDGLVLRGLHTIIVDEADSVLIDEAVTPLIIAAPHEHPTLKQACEMANEIVSDLELETDYRPNLRYKEIELTASGRNKIATRCSLLPGLWRGTDRRLELVRQALVAREFYQRDKQYIIQDDKLVIVDEFTGRPMPQRSWRQGMHQAIEAKEGIDISNPTETVARLSFQRFFRLFHNMSGMTGTASEAAGEFWQIYRLPVIRIPTNKPCLREHGPDRVFADEDSKWAAIVSEIERVHATGRPLLVGTRSVAASEKLAGLLTERRLDFHLLNASRHSEEAVIIADAGATRRITIATNMAGRGTDIKLGKGVAEAGGLHVIATERHESGRVDRQLFGRSARQGDPGSAQAFFSTDDELLRRYVPATMRRTATELLRRKFPGGEAAAKSAFALAQKNAQALAFKQRRAVLRMDKWLDEALSFAGVSDV